MTNTDLDSNKIRKLFPHQIEAINSWFDNNKRGIFEMATGTGKTFTAINCLEKVFEDEDVVCVIACPLIYLVEQWANEVRSFENLEDDVYTIYGSKINWKKDLHSLMFNLELGVKSKAIILTTHNTFANPKFIKELYECNKKLFLIVDEMHHVGSKKLSQGLLNIYDYRLGLSATPSIYMNEEATNYLNDYFGGIVTSFTLKDALTTINPATNKFYLTEYNYYPIKVDLTEEEMEYYLELTDKISKLMIMNKTKCNSISEETLTGLKVKRKHIINNAFNKDYELRKILRNLEEPDHLIIYATHHQIKRVLRILGEENIKPKHKFTKDEGINKLEEYDNRSEREFLIDKFDKGEYKALVAIKCLDEGVDVPSADKVIIMSSSTNPREYIQRRGRVLRRFTGKNIATIYDMIVIPTNDKDEDYVKNIIKNEKNRLYEFIESANNKDECYKLLKKWGI